MSSSKPEGAALSEREEQVLVFATQGLTDKEIARKLGISTATVLTYWMRIRQKLGGSNRAELVASAVRRDADSVLGIKETENHQLLGEILRRMQAEQALREANQRLSFHFDNAPVAIIEMDSEFRVRRWSAGAEKTFGWTAEEVDGKKFAEWKFVFEEDASQVSKMSQDLSAGRAAFAFIANRNYRKDGTVLDCEWYNSALVDDDGKFVSVLSVVMDLTERNTFQRELQKSESRLQAVIDGAPMIILLKDVRGQYALVNQACEELIGMRREDVIGRSDEDLFHPNVAKALSEQDRRVLESGQPSEQEHHLATPSGNRLVSMVKFPLSDADGTVYAICGIARDLTAKHQTEQALVQTEQLLREALRATQTGYWIWDIQKGGHIWSEEMESIHGLKPGTFDGSIECFTKAVPHEDLEQVMAATSRATEHGEPYEMEFRITGHDGRTRWIASRAHVFHGADGQPVRMVGFNQDVTQRKEAEVAVSRYRVLFQSLPDAAFVLDKAGAIVEANEAACTMLGVTSSDLEGRKLLDFASGEAVGDREAQVALAAVAEVWEGPMHLRDHRGRAFSADCRSSSIDGGELRVVLVRKTARVKDPAVKAAVR